MAYEWSATVADKNGDPAERTIIAYREATGMKAGETQSDASGNYTMITGFWDAHRLVASGEPDRNDLVLAGMVPEISGGAAFPTFNLDFGLFKANVSSGSGGTFQLVPDREEPDVTGANVRSLYLTAYSGPSDAIRAFTNPTHPRDMGIGAEEAIIQLGSSMTLFFANPAMVGSQVLYAPGNREVLITVNSGGTSPDNGTPGVWGSPGSFSTFLDWDIPDDEAQTIDIDLTLDYRREDTQEMLARVNLLGQVQPVDTAV